MKITQTDFGVSISTDGPATIDLKITPVAVAAAPTPDPVPVTPPPPVVTPPAPLSTGLVPALIQHYPQTPDAEGFFVSQPGWQADIANLGFDVAGIDYKKTLALEFDRQQSYDATGKNVKIIRGWKNQSMPGTASACNVYAGKTKEDWKIVYVEGSDMVASQETTNYSYSGGKMRRERWEVVFNSAPGIKDGIFRRFIDGVPEFEKAGIAFDSVAHPGLPTFWCLQDDYSPNAGDSGPFSDASWVKCRPVSITVK